MKIDGQAPFENAMSNAYIITLNPFRHFIIESIEYAEPKNDVLDESRRLN